MPKIFLTYILADKSFVDKFYNVLKLFSPDILLDERDIPGKSDVHLNNASHILYFLSRKSIELKWFREEDSITEMGKISKKDTRILPILIENLDDLPVSREKCADFRNKVIDISLDNFQYVLRSLGIGSEEEIKDNIQTSKQRRTRDSISSILLISADLLVILADISFYLKFATEPEKDHVSIRRLAETKNKILYQQLPDKFEPLFVNLEEIKNLSIVSPLITEVERKFDDFIHKIKEVLEYKPVTRPDTKWLYACSESSRSLQMDLDQLFQFLLLFHT